MKHRWLTGDVWPQIYTPQSQFTSRSFRIVVRAESGDPGSLATPVREAIWSIDPGLPIGGARTMSEVVRQSLGPIQIISGLLTLFGALALLLACVGIYGVVAYSVSRRLNEFGVRMALGAQAPDIVKLVLRHGVILTGLGVAIGLAIAIALSQVVSSTVAGVAPAGPVILAADAIPLAAVSLTASYLPARRAAKVDPLTALRYE